MWQLAKLRSFQKRAALSPESINIHWPPSAICVGPVAGTRSRPCNLEQPDMRPEAVRVLLVEDELQTQLTPQMANLLITWGCDVEIAKGAADALKKLGRFDPRIVICNLLRPLALAVDLTESIHYCIPDVNCIIIVEHEESEEAAEALRAGASVLASPLDPEKLRVLIQNCFRSGRPM
jgi:DNA-binding NtrC family response regulator